MDRSVNLIADLVANGRTFDKILTESPVTVVSDAAASPAFMQLGASGGMPTYECYPPGTPDVELCTGARVFTLEEEARELG